MGSWVNGLNHLGLVVENIQVAKEFFVDFLGLELIEDRGELLFISAGSDILAIKTPSQAVNQPEAGVKPAFEGSRASGWQALDHYGFFASSREQVTLFADKLAEAGVEILKGPYDRSDGRSVYFRDPCGNVGEYFYFERNP